MKQRVAGSQVAELQRAQVSDQSGTQLQTPRHSSTSSYTLVDFDDFAILHHEHDQLHAFRMRLVQSATWTDTTELVGVAAIVAAPVFILWNFGSLEK